MSHPTAEGGEEVVINAAQAPNVHAHPPSTPFTLLCHPEHWDVFLTDQGAEVLPRLKRLPHQPGVAGVEQMTLGDGRIVGNPMRAIAAMRSKGWIELPTDMPIVAFGSSYRGYVHRYQGTRGAIHLERWCRLYKVGTSTHRSDDRAGYHAFLRQIRDRFLDGGPEQGIAEAMRANLARELGRAKVSAGRSAGAAAAVDVLAKKLEAFKRLDAPRSSLHRPGDAAPPDEAEAMDPIPNATPGTSLATLLGGKP